MKEPNGQAVAVGYGGLAFDSGRGLLIHRFPFKQLTVAYLAPDGTRSPIPQGTTELARTTR